MRGDYLDRWRSAPADVKMRWLEEITPQVKADEDSRGSRGATRVVDDRMRHRFQRLSANRKLLWLEESIQFIRHGRSKMARRFQGLLREGKI